MYVSKITGNIDRKFEAILQIAITQCVHPKKGKCNVTT